MAYLDGITTWLQLSLAVVFALLLYVYFRVDRDTKRFREHWDSTGDGAAGGIIAFILTLAGLALLAYLLNRPVEAAEWFKYTEVYAGLDRTMQLSPQCEANDVDDRFTSNGGLRQHIVTLNGIDVQASYLHHSCAVGVDAAGYDAIGLQFNWRFNRR